VLASACLAVPAHAADRVYWMNGTTSANSISFANLNGSGGAGTLSTAGATVNAPRGVAMNLAAGKVYWTNRTGNRISFANLDGSGGGGDLNTSPVLPNMPNAAAVLPTAGRVYWANEGSNTISFASLNGSGGGPVNTSGATIGLPIAPVVDPASGRIYWGNGGAVNVISYADLNGSGGDDLNTGAATVANPHGLALDPVARRVYWANQAGTTISYANLDGSGGGNLNTGAATVSTPIGVAIDPTARRIYWANYGTNTLSFANLNGSGGANLSTPGARLQGVRSPVLLKAPSGTGAPALTGGSSAGSVLTCSPGSWAQDLLGSWLYRSPQRLAYSWSRNGATIAGASGNTYPALRGGDYRCTVTATNPAGSGSQTSAARAVAGGSSSGKKRAFGAKTLVTLKLGAQRVRARGPLKVVIRNDNRFSVSGRLSARIKRRAAAKSRSFEVSATTRKSVSLKLSKTARRTLKRRGKLSLRLSVKIEDPAGNTRTVAKRASVRRKK
jgi:DNA-binding beta-propeller fold protein YncE